MFRAATGHKSPTTKMLQRGFQLLEFWLQIMNLSTIYDLLKCFCEEHKNN